jgi:hypothetical protein
LVGLIRASADQWQEAGVVKSGWGDSFMVGLKNELPRTVSSRLRGVLHKKIRASQNVVPAMVAIVDSEPISCAITSKSDFPCSRCRLRSKTGNHLAERDGCTQAKTPLDW